MADQSDVETAIAAVVANALYPNGPEGLSEAGYVCRVYRGTPVASALNADLASGVANISINAIAGRQKNVTRYPQKWVATSTVPATLSVATSGYSVCISGICAAGQLVGIVIDGAPFAYAVQSNDSPATVASNIAGLLRQNGWVVDYAGTCISIPQAVKLTARAVSGGTMLKEIRRQVQDFDIALWCPDPRSRDIISALADRTLATINFIVLSDGSSGRMISAGSDISNANVEASLYRRDLIYSVEYPTTLQQGVPGMLFGVEVLQADGISVETQSY